MQAKRKSLVLVYTGDGKGKSSAAMGQAMRALGHGAKVAVAQFIKDDPAKLDCGEFKTASSLGVVWKNFGKGFTWEGDNDNLNRELSKKGWEQVKRWVSTSMFDMIVLDEFTYTLNLGYLDVEQVCTWIGDHKDKEGFPHLVITGRGAPDQLIAIADLVSEIREIKHHLKGARQQAQAMIEY